MTSLELAARLDAKASRDGWEARCPAHEDHRASLSINAGDDGRVLLYCHAGCPPEAIVSALGISMADLFREKDSVTKPRIVATYDYQDESETLLFQVVRYEPKGFKQRRPDGRGGWTWKVGNVRRVLFLLPDVRLRLTDERCREYRREQGLTDDVFIPESEKDVERLWQRGLVATTNAGGTGKWRAEYAQQLIESGAKSVVILPDNDDPGRKHAVDVAQSCQAAGLIVKVIALPDLPEKGDVADWLRTHTLEDLIARTRNAQAGAPPTSTTNKNLAETLTTVETFIRQYVVLSHEASALMALWAAQTHAGEAFDYVAYLHIKSPMPECGKTRTLEVLEALVKRPWLTGRVTAAVLMRKVDAEHPVLLLDESDAAFNGDKEYGEALRGQLNTGFHRSGKASACVGQGANITYKDFSTFGPKAIAGIGRLDPTIESRSIPIVLKRRTRVERIEKWRRRNAWTAAEPLRSRLSVLTAHTDTLRAARPALPEGLSDRAEDVLEPLFALADLAGGDWPERARAAALALMGTAARVAQEAGQHLGLELLADLQAIFAERGNPDVLETKVIINALAAMDDKPWPTFTKGEKPITPHRLRRMLKDFDIQKPRKEREGEDTFRGYRFDAFTDAFARYLPSNVEQVEQPNKNGHELAKIKVEHEASVPLSKSTIHPDKHCLVPLVPLSQPVLGDREDDDGDEFAVYGGA